MATPYLKVAGWATCPCRYSVPLTSHMLSFFLFGVARFHPKRQICSNQSFGIFSRKPPFGFCASVRRVTLRFRWGMRPDFFKVVRIVSRLTDLLSLVLNDTDIFRVLNAFFFINRCASVAPIFLGWPDRVLSFKYPIPRNAFQWYEPSECLYQT